MAQLEKKGIEGSLNLFNLLHHFIQERLTRAGLVGGRAEVINNFPDILERLSEIDCGKPIIYLAVPLDSADPTFLSEDYLLTLEQIGFPRSNIFNPCEFTPPEEKNATFVNNGLDTKLLALRRITYRKRVVLAVCDLVIVHLDDSALKEGTAAEITLALRRRKPIFALRTGDGSNGHSHIQTQLTDFVKGLPSGKVATSLEEHQCQLQEYLTSFSDSEEGQPDKLSEQEEEDQRRYAEWGGKE